MCKVTGEPIGTTAGLEEDSAEFGLELPPAVTLSVSVAKLAVILEITVTLRRQCSSHQSQVFLLELTFNIQCLQGMFLLPIIPFFILSWYDPLEDPDIALGLTLDIALSTMYIYLLCEIFLE